jgi:ubiquinone/menaquinone biosynthesis C-methylase UbiE
MKSKNESQHDKNVAAVYEARAKVYHKAGWTRDKEQIKSIFKFVDLKKSDLALEIGIGTGLLAREVANKVKAIYGIDPTLAMLEQLPDSINRANIINMKAEKLPYLDKVFDVTYWRSVIMHTVDPQKIINEAFRVTKNGGRVFLVEPIELSNSARDFIFAAINLKDDTHHYYFTVKDLYNRLSRAGYKNLKHSIYSGSMVFNAWMAGGAIDQKKKEKMWAYFYNAPEKYKKEFNIKFSKHDFTFDIKFIILKGKKI